MFINCPNCSALVATNLATGLPPERCAQCGFGPLAQDAVAVPAFPPAPLAPPPEPEPVQPQARPVFIPLTPSRPSAGAGEDPPAELEEPAATRRAAPEPASDPVAPPRRAVSPAATPPPASPDPAPAEPPPAAPGPDAASTEAADTEPPPAETCAPEPPADEPALEVPAEAPAAAAPVRPAPRFLARSAGDPAPLDRRHVAIAAGLALLLVVQLLLADRERLAGHAAWRPLVAALCAPLPCSVPPWREPAAIRVQERDVRPAPGRPGVLRVSATIHNEARWAQAWPQLVLTFSDLDGRALGMRAFEPAEYLAAPPTDVTIASGQQAAVAMDIVEPSPHAVAFNFDFR